jgi:gas vesicle protein
MNRWITSFIGVAVGIIVGVVAALVLAPRLRMAAIGETGSVGSRIQSLESELAALARTNHDLEQRLAQVGREQERLAQENALLRTQRTTELLLQGQTGRDTPATRPPK